MLFFHRPSPLLVLPVLLTTHFLLAQPASQISGPSDNQQRVVLRGNVHPLAQARYDRGAVPDSFPAERMFLLLRRSPELEAALREFLQNAHRPGNPSYHQWLRPEQFGKLYGPAASDVATVTSWLQSQGFSVARASRGKTAIEFSGNAGQVRNAFHTEIHTYRYRGEVHHANNRDPEIPAALAPVVAGIAPMNDFQPVSYATTLGRALYNPDTRQVTPAWTFGSAPVLALAPGDFAVQYDLNPLYSAGIKGTGVTIGIIGASNVDPAMVATYRTLFGLPANPINVVIDGRDPGLNAAMIESYLDVEVAGAVAPGATINLYTAAGTWVQYGLYLAALRAVDDDVATVLSTSYGLCEQNFGSAGNQFWAGVWEQAAAQGQTSFVSSGDGGPAGCDNFNIPQPAQYGIAVNGISSTAWNVSVGGTDFFYRSYNGSPSQQSAELATYWNLTPSGLPVTTLLQPVPEQPWDRPFGLNLYTGGVYDPNAPNIIAGSGGPSNCSSGVDASNGTYASCTGGYAKPSWQSGTGVPADGVRDLPDVSLFAAAGENNSFYPICVFPGDCVPVNGGVYLVGAGGTSASSPAMAGIMALINQKYGAQGQANFKLYPLAAQHPSVFHDVAIASNDVPCQQGSPNCTLSTANDNTKGFYTLGGFYAGKGYDMATGLGSVDANLLVTYWNSLSFKPTNTTLNLGQTSFAHGTPVNVSVAVTGSGGTPSGDVALTTTASPAANAGLGELTLQSGTASATINSFPGGQYKVTARYAGDNLFASSNSNAVTVNVAPENSTLSLFGNYYDYTTGTSGSLSDGGSYVYGTYIWMDGQPHGVNVPPGTLDGIPTGSVTFADTASTGTVNSGAVNLDRSGLAQWLAPQGFAVGSHSLSASYSGDASFNASSSGTPLTFAITKATPMAFLHAYPQTVGLGATTTLSMEVGILSYVARPTGTVTFSYGSTVLGTATLGKDPNSWVLSLATLNVSSLPLGVNTVTAQYGGDANFAPVSGTVTVTVLQPSNLSATVNPASFNQAQSFTVTATVPGVAGLPAPTGGVFFDAVGNGQSWSAGATIVNGTASFTFDGWNFLPGTITIQVSYLGDSTYAPVTVSTSATVTIPFTVSATPLTIAAGATLGNTSTVTVTPANGFTGTVYLSCALTSSPNGAQHPPGCGLSTATVNITGTNAATDTATIYSTPPTTSALRPVHGPGWLGANAGAVVAGVFVFGVAGKRRRQKGAAAMLVALALLLSLVACGGGGGNHQVIPGTTPGVYTFTVTASFTATIGASRTQEATVKVTIQ